MSIVMSFNFATDKIVLRDHVWVARRPDVLGKEALAVVFEPSTRPV